ARSGCRCSTCSAARWPAWPTAPPRRARTGSSSTGRACRAGPTSCAWRRGGSTPPASSLTSNRHARSITMRYGYLLLIFLIAASSASAQSPGTCELGTARTELDVNGVRARLYNKGNLFFDGGDPNYEIPPGSGTHSIFAAGIWMVGHVNDELRLAAANYAPRG